MFPKNQIKKLQEKSSVSPILIEIMNSAVQKAKEVHKNYFDKSQETTKGGQLEFDFYEKMDKTELGQILGTFMPVFKLTEADAYMLGTLKKKVKCSQSKK